MGFFGKLGAMVGIGAAKVEINLNSTTFSAGEEITGEIILTGGKVEQLVEELHVELTETIKTYDQTTTTSTEYSETTTTEEDEFFSDDDSENSTTTTTSSTSTSHGPSESYKTTTLADVILVQNLTVKDGYKESYSFSIKLHEETQVSDGDFRVYKIYAWAGVPKAIDPTDTKKIEVN